MSQKNGVVHLWELPEDKICIKLHNNLQRKMIEKAISLVPSYKDLANKINVNRSTLFDFRNSRFSTTSLAFVKRLSDFLVSNGMSEFSIDNLESKLELIKCKGYSNAIYKPKFPLNFNNKVGAELISAMLFDGGIASDCHPFYTNEEKELIKKISNCAQELLGDIKFSRKNSHKVPEIAFPKILGYILIFGLSMNKGKKVFTDPEIPKFVLDSNFEIKRGFLQQAFDDEGTVNVKCKKICLPQNTTNPNKPPIRLIQLKNLLEEFGILVNGPYFSYKKIRKSYTSYSWVIEITGQSEIRSFREKINFYLERKTRKLNELIDSYVLSAFKKGTNYDEILKVCNELKKDKKPITISNIAFRLKRSKSQIYHLTPNLIKHKRLKIIKTSIPQIGEFGFKEMELDIY